MSREKLIEMTEHNIAHSKAGTIDMEPEVFKVPAEKYYDEEQYKAEVDKIFKRVPLLLATTAELPNPGDYKAMEAVGTPLIITRDSDGDVRAFMNMCSHRGAAIVDEGCGNTKRFMCPYHAWTFNQKGDLIGIASQQDFGDLDKSEYGLVPLPVEERAGLIWVCVRPDSDIDFDAFLSGYDELLANFGFETWHLHDQRRVEGPNWKVAYDGYLDLYHLPVLHSETFGTEISNQALYYNWGPHQRVSSPSPFMVGLEDMPKDQWQTEWMLMGVWTVFPHISIASFDGGGRSVMLSQLFPGDTPGESYTVQNYLMENAPDEEQAKQADEQFKLLEYVVETEDYGTGLRLQKALQTGVKDHVLFGRNEGGGQRFHGWVDKIIETEDEDLNKLFAGSNN
jgi:nitrite reductase/ring-hydroxylating ferredoxin subunit